MDWKRLLFAWDGRIGRRAYWSVVLPMLITNALAAFLDSMVFGFGQAQAFSGLVGLVLLYPYLVVSAKRLHDLGCSGWLQLAPPAAMVLADVLMATVEPNGPPLSTLAQIAALATAVCGFGFWLWVAFARGANGPNRFGLPDSGAREVAPPPPLGQPGFEPGD